MDPLLEGTEPDPLALMLEALAQPLERHEIVERASELSGAGDTRHPERVIRVGRRHHRHTLV